MWGVDDGREVRDAEHAKVRDGEGAALYRGRCLRYRIIVEHSKTRTWYSWGWSLPSLAFLASALVVDEIVARPLAPTSLTIGVIRPVGVATAIEMSDFLYLYYDQIE